MTDRQATPIGSLHKAALRNYIFDSDEWESEYASEMEKHDLHAGYSALTWSSLQTVVRRHFSPTSSLADVIRYVAELRMFLAEHASLLNPGLAEKIIRSLLGDNSLNETPPFGEAPEDMLGAALLLLTALVADADLDESGVDELINEAANNIRQFDWSPLPSGERAAGSPLEGGRDENKGAAPRQVVGREPSRGAGGGWESS